MRKAEQLARLLDTRQRVDNEIEQLRREINGVVCGTDSMYYHHRRVRNEPACDECRRAHAAAERRRKTRKATA